jgi:hypothetical protein
MRMKNPVPAKVLLYVAAVAFCAYCQSHDSLKTSLPFVFLSSTPKPFPGGMPAAMPPPKDPAARNVFYFTFDPAVEGARINYTGGNLAKAVQPVPEAYREMKKYRNLRIAAPALLTAGIAAIAGSTAYQMLNQDRYKKDATETPDFTGVGVGIGLCLSSAIPEFLSRSKIEKAVQLYNARAGDSTAASPHPAVK